VLSTECGTFWAKGSEGDREQKEQHFVLREEEVAIWGKNITFVVAQVRHLSAGI